MIDSNILLEFYSKNTLVTGGTGLIGREVVKILCNSKAKVKVVSLDDIIVDEIKPDVIALGYDQRLFTRVELEGKLLSRGLKVKVVRLPEMEQDLAGSRKIIAKILKIYRKKNIEE